MPQAPHAAGAICSRRHLPDLPSPPSAPGAICLMFCMCLIFLPPRLPHAPCAPRAMCCEEAAVELQSCIKDQEPQGVFR